jgi:hypothetical protein
MRNPTIGMLRSIFATTALLTVTVVHAQNANVVAATSVTNRIEQVTPTPPPNGSATVLNTDPQGTFKSIVSLAFNNSGPSLNLLAADNLNHQVVQYTGDFNCAPNPCTTVSLVVVPNGVPPQSPQGLSLDRAGDLYIVNNTPGKSPQPAVYVAPTDTMGGFGSVTPIDTSHFGSSQALVETLIVGTPPSNGADIGPLLKNGDLLVLATGPNALFKYPANGAPGPVPGAQQTTLLAQCGSGGPKSLTCIPTGEMPRGIAIWKDGTLLMTMQSGRIMRYDFSGAAPKLLADFADLTSGLAKIKVGVELGQFSAFVAQSTSGNKGSVIQLTTNAQGLIAVVANVNTGGTTQGIALTNTVQVVASKCQDVQNNMQVGGCDPLGGNGITVIRHDDKIDPKANPNAGQLTGAVVDDLCVATEKRTPVGLAACGNQSLSINNQMCPGFDNTGQNLQLAPYMCCEGGNGHQCAIVRVKDNHINYDQTLVSNFENWDSLLPGNNPTCNPVNEQQTGQIPLGAYGWTLGETPLAGVTGEAGVEDYNSGCDGPIPRGGNISLFVEGAVLDCYADMLNMGPFYNNPSTQTGRPACLWNFQNIKYTDMLTTVANLASGNGGSVPAITQTEALLLTNTIPNGSGAPPGCIDTSLSLFTTGAHSLDAATQTAYFQAAANVLTNAAVSMTPNTLTASPVQSALSTDGTTGSLTPNTTYYYVVTAIGAAGETLASNEQSITTGGTNMNENIVIWSWSQGTGAAATGYNIYRGTASGSENFLVGTVSGSTTQTYTDTGATSAAGIPPGANTTCDSIVTNNLAAFTEQLGGGAPHYNPSPILNPSGQVRAGVANAEYTDATLIVSTVNSAPASWPPPVTINASCQPYQVNCISNVDATNNPIYLTWAVDPSVATGCTLTSSDGVYGGAPVSGLTQPLPIQPPAGGIYYQYQITCNVPNNITVQTPPGPTISATAWVVNNSVVPQ